MTTVRARDLSLRDVHELFGYQPQWCDSFTDLLPLPSLTDFEEADLRQIQADYREYWEDSKLLEGMVKVLTVLPLLRLAGFYRAPIKLRLEENIEHIAIENGNTTISGRCDLLAVNKHITVETGAYFWVLLVESKNSAVDYSAGFPQLLTYAYNSLSFQNSVWGLTTNGKIFQFIHILAGETPTYQILPVLNLLELEPAIKILQVLKAIAQL